MRDFVETLGRGRSGSNRCTRMSARSEMEGQHSDSSGRHRNVNCVGKAITLRFDSSFVQDDAESAE